jgi:hypothetical protein
MNAAGNLVWPPILRLPTELQLHIISFLSTRVRRCCPTKVGDHRPSATFDRRRQVHRVPGQVHRVLGQVHRVLGHVHDPLTSYWITITDAAILSLRCTNVRFSILIPLTHKLLLDIERSFHALHRTLLACCVCLRLRPGEKFAIHSATQTLDSENQKFVAKYRFCIDCGFSTYPHPHPNLLPRRQQRRLGMEPLGMTTYAPGTKIKFRTRRLPLHAFHVWVWCMDCRLLKIGAEAGSLQCRLFCRDCCERLGCRSLRFDVIHHVNYEGIKLEIDTETQRRHGRLKAGAIYIARGSSFLLKNKEYSGYKEQEEEDDGGQDGAE